VVPLRSRKSFVSRVGEVALGKKERRENNYTMDKMVPFHFGANTPLKLEQIGHKTPWAMVREPGDRMQPTIVSQATPTQLKFSGRRSVTLLPYEAAR
jgi:hypothetical protein